MSTATSGSINSMARKVLEAVPMNEPWSVHAIHNELARSGKHLDRAVVTACLVQLHRGKLVKQIKPDLYQRVKVKVRASPLADDAVPLSEGILMPKPATPKASDDTVDHLGALSARLRQLSADAVSLAKRLDDIANEIDTAAIETAQRLERYRGDGEKLRQLQALLKTIGTDDV